MSNPASKHATRERTQAAMDRATGLTETDMFDSPFAKMMSRARWDLDYFAEHVLGIKGHGGQQRLWDVILRRDQSGWRPRYLTICCSAGNRAGKTLGIAIPILHSVMFKHGMKPPNLNNDREVERWNNLPYEWYHFAIAQETAELVFIEITRILTGTHEAQKNGCPLLDMLGPGVATWEKKYRGEYLWLQMNPLLGGGNIHFRTTGEKAIGSLGKDMNGVSYDECGFDPHFDFIVNEVLNLRRLSTGGQFFLISTPTEGLTAFADKWYEGDPEAPDKRPYAMSLRMSTRDNIGFGIDQEQFNRITSEVPLDLIPQNIDGLFIEGTKAFFSQKATDQAFSAGVEERVAPARGRVYVQGVDPALTFDSCWNIVLRGDPNGQWVGVDCNEHKGRTTGPVIAATTTNLHNAYTHPKGWYRCSTGIDATGFGGHMFRDLLYIEPLYSIEFGGTRGKKLQLLNDLKQALETGKLRFPRAGKWLILRRQLLGYRLDDKNLHTDAVMALAVAWAIAKREPAGSSPFGDFDFFGTQSRMSGQSSW